MMAPAAAPSLALAITGRANRMIRQPDGRTLDIGTSMTILHRLLFAFALVALASIRVGMAADTPVRREAPATSLPSTAGAATGFPGVGVDQLTAEHWIALAKQPDALLLDSDRIAAHNQRLLREDASMHDIDALPSTLDGAQVATWLRALSKRPGKPLFDRSGAPIGQATVDGWMAAIALDAVATSQPTRYALIVSRANLRTFPTAQRVFSAPGDTDIDRFRETALFPGTPVVIAHESRDRQWWFVVAATYAAWVDKRAVAEGSRTQVLGYGRRTPSLVVTGATVRTTITPSPEAVSALPLDMGVRVPRLAGWPPLQPVNGQLPTSSYVIELPVRDGEGRLQLVPALLPRSADVSPDYLPLTRANLLRQSFKFLGERYGWGHDYGARDCSGFLSEVYRSMGVQLPRNTGDQAGSPPLARTAFGTADGWASRNAALKALDIGDMVHIPGHVMLVIGGSGGVPYVIHDIQSTGLIGSDGTLQRLPLNGVSVTPLTTLHANATQSYVDRMTAIVRVER